LKQGITDSKALFSGHDIWTAYELSWLDAKGKPCVAIASLYVPAESEYMVESKSLKLYLNSLNQMRFDSKEDVSQLVVTDISTLLGCEVTLLLHSIDAFTAQGVAQPEGDCLDDIPLNVDQYDPSPLLLSADSDTPVEESLYSHLLKSNCRITSQPDWATVFIRYSGPKIDREGLLKYIIGFRTHDEFHEPCVEKIFHEIMHNCQPEKLTVYARYTRRGGLDINPFRSNFESTPSINDRLARQ
jgi:7-cyano-7-deazaguanine reductase